MARKSMAVVVCSGVVLCSLASCGLLNHHRVDAPPSGEQETATWWQRTADDLPPTLLAIYMAASEAHLRRGTSATYVYEETFSTMMNRMTHERRLPSPPPEAILAQMRKRLETSTLNWPGFYLRVQVRDCRGCTTDEAAKMWQIAAESLGTDEKK